MKVLVVLILIFLAYKALMRNASIKVYRNFRKQNTAPEIKPEGTVTVEKDTSHKNDEGFTDYVEVKE